MRITTVGDVIKALQQYDLSTPVVKSDPGGPGMFEITLTAKAVFWVVPCGHIDGIAYFVDSLRSNRIGFEAVVL